MHRMQWHGNGEEPGRMAITWYPANTEGKEAARKTLRLTFIHLKSKFPACSGRHWKLDALKRVRQEDYKF